MTPTQYITTAFDIITLLTITATYYHLHKLSKE